MCDCLFREVLDEKDTDTTDTTDQVLESTLVLREAMTEVQVDSDIL